MGQSQKQQNHQYFYVIVDYDGLFAIPFVVFLFVLAPRLLG